MQLLFRCHGRGVAVPFAAGAEHPDFVPASLHLQADPQATLVHADQRIAVLIVDHAVRDEENSHRHYRGVRNQEEDITAARTA